MNMILNSEVTTTLIKFITNINFHCGKLMTVFFKMLSINYVQLLCNNNNTNNNSQISLKRTMNEFHHCTLALLKQQQERSEKFRPEGGFEPVTFAMRMQCSTR